MKKIKLTLLIILSAIMVPNIVNASDLNIIIDCGNVVNQGETITCKIKGNAGEGTSIYSVDAKITATGVASIESITAASGWTPFPTGNDSIYYIADASEGVTKSFDIANIKMRTNGAGTATLKITNIIGVDQDYNNINVDSRTKNISVIAPTTAPTTRTTRTTTIRTTKPITSITTKKITEIVTTQPIVIPLKLDTVTVDDFEVTFENGIYFATVDSTTDKVTISATADPTIEIVGQGQRTLATGKNVVELVIRNSADQTATIQVVITRPEDTGTHDVSLYKLKIVNYDFDFYKNKYEYTVSIPYNIKEIFVIAESNNPDVTITGAGVNKLESGSNDLTINVKYGDLANQKYIIHVQRDYKQLLMLIGLIVSISGFGVFFIFHLIQKGKLVGEKEYEVNKALADAKRQMEEQEKETNLNENNDISIHEEIKQIPQIATTTTISEERQPTEVLEVVSPTGQPDISSSTSTYSMNNAVANTPTPVESTPIADPRVIPQQVNTKVIETNRPQISVVTTGNTVSQTENPVN